MKVDYLARFDREFQKLHVPTQESVKKAIVSLLHHLQVGTRPQGLGLRRLRGIIWEIRVGLTYRILFELKKDTITFAFIGTHDEVKRFLRTL